MKQNKDIKSWKIEVHHSEIYLFLVVSNSISAAEQLDIQKELSKLLRESLICRTKRARFSEMNHNTVNNCNEVLGFTYSAKLKDYGSPGAFFFSITDVFDIIDSILSVLNSYILNFEEDTLNKYLNGKSFIEAYSGMSFLKNEIDENFRCKLIEIIMQNSEKSEEEKNEMILLIESKGL